MSKIVETNNVVYAHAGYTKSDVLHDSDIYAIEQFFNKAGKGLKEIVTNVDGAIAKLYLKEEYNIEELKSELRIKFCVKQSEINTIIKNL
jgi:hypothetical protein